MSGLFAYAAYTRAGEVEKGEVEAQSLESAAVELSGRGLSVFDLKPKLSAGGGLLERDLFTRSGLNSGEKEQLLRLLSALIGAKLPVDQALRSVSSGDDNSALAKTVSRLYDRIVAGQSLSDAVGAEDNKLPASWAALIRAGESSGQLDQVLQELATAQERSNRVAAEIKSALIYPVLLGGLAVITVGFIVTVLLPALRPLIEETGGQLPAPVAVLMGMSESIRTQPVIWGLAGLLGVFGIVRAFRSETVRLAWGKWSLRLPLVGTLIREINTARICATLGLLLANRVEQLRAVSITRTVVTHGSYDSLLLELYEHVQNGGTLSKGLSNHDLVPDQVLNLISAGERTGRIADMLKESGKLMEDNSKRTLDRLVGLLTPALTLLLGLVIGGIVLSVMTTLMSVNRAAF